MSESEVNVKPKAYSYLRFSSPEQMKGDSRRRQTHMAAEYVRRHGLELDTELTFQDLGVSAYRSKNARTGALRAFLDLVEEGIIPEGSYLLVESLDRISRDQIIDAQVLFLQIIRAGVVLVTLIDERVYSTESINANPTDLIVSLLALMRAHEESSTKARRLKDAWKGKRLQAEKKPLTSISPAWVQLDKEAGKFELLEDKAAVVQRIFEMHLDGAGQNTIAYTLNEEKVPPFGRAEIWHRSYIKKILESPSVIGRMIPHEIEYVDGKRVRKPLEPVEAYYPAVIDDETFQRVQSLRSNRYTPKANAGRRKVRNLLAGLAKCPLCGSTMTRVMKGKHSKPRLVCTKAKAGAGCTYKSVILEQVEEVIIGEADVLIATAPSGSTDIDTRLEEMEVVEGQLKEQIGNLVDAIAASPSPILSRKLRDLESGLEELRVEQKELFRKSATLTGPLMEKKIEELSAALKEEPVDVSRANVNLRQLLSGVVVDYEKGLLLFEWQQGGISTLNFAWPMEQS